MYWCTAELLKTASNLGLLDNIPSVSWKLVPYELNVHLKVIKKASFELILSYLFS